MKDFLGRIIYVGKAKSLKKRVSSYFQSPGRLAGRNPKIHSMVHAVSDLDFVALKSEPEALLLEGKLIKQWKPKYNTDFVDDKRFLLVRVDMGSELPRFELVRTKRGDEALYFGPFANSGFLRKTLTELQRQFGILLWDARPVKREDGTWRQYNDLRSEIYGQPNEVTATDYKKNVAEACTFLEGKSKEWLGLLQKEMQATAKKQNFEKAARLRNDIHAIETTARNTKLSGLSPDVGRGGDPQAALLKLRDALGLETLPAHLECFDVSHISGEYCVASLVHFSNGRPDKRLYRRFKIKSFSGNDDFRAMEEVVERHYRRLHEEKRSFPDVVVIDGGKGQLRSALRAFLKQGLEPPALIGLAKREETIIFTNQRQPLNLPPQDEARRLLQHLRNEAHRFANSYNARLRSRKLRQSVLDQIPGLGATRQKALLARFKNLKALKAATTAELMEVEGVGPKLAAKIHDFLQSLP